MRDRRDRRDRTWELTPEVYVKFFGAPRRDGRARGPEPKYIFTVTERDIKRTFPPDWVVKADEPWQSSWACIMEVLDSIRATGLYSDADIAALSGRLFNRKGTRTRRLPVRIANDPLFIIPGRFKSEPALDLRGHRLERLTAGERRRLYLHLKKLKHPMVHSVSAWLDKLDLAALEAQATDIDPAELAFVPREEMAPEREHKPDCKCELCREHVESRKQGTLELSPQTTRDLGDPDAQPDAPEESWEDERGAKPFEPKPKRNPRSRDLDLNSGFKSKFTRKKGAFMVQAPDETRGERGWSTAADIMDEVRGPRPTGTVCPTCQHVGGELYLGIAADGSLHGLYVCNGEKHHEHGFEEVFDAVERERQERGMRRAPIAREDEEV